MAVIVSLFSEFSCHCEYDYVRYEDRVFLFAIYLDGATYENAWNNFGGMNVLNEGDSMIRPLCGINAVP